MFAFGQKPCAGFTESANRMTLDAKELRVLSLGRGPCEVKKRLGALSAKLGEVGDEKRNLGTRGGEDARYTVHGEQELWRACEARRGAAAAAASRRSRGFESARVLSWSTSHSPS